MLGELLASQLHHHIGYNVLKPTLDKDISLVGQKKVGEFLTKKVFEPGAMYRWNKMIEQATGEQLTPKYFVEQFVR
jgi:peptidyl-dipeptidase A